MTAETWAAVAAIFSAGAAWLSWRQQSKSQLNSIRPMLLLEEWSFEEYDNRGEIRIGKIRNVGNGPAQHISLVLRSYGGPIVTTQVAF